MSSRRRNAFVWHSPRNVFSWHCWDTCTLTNQAGSLSQTDLLLYFRGNYQALTVQFQKCKFPEGRGGSESICLSSAVCRSIRHIPNPNSTSFKNLSMLLQEEGHADHTHRLCALRPSCSWRSPGGSRPHTGTNSLLVHGSPPPAAWWHWWTPPALSGLMGEDRTNPLRPLYFSNRKLRLAKPLLVN